MVKTAAANVTDILSQPTLFGDLPLKALRALRAMQIRVSYPRGSTLFSQGETPAGIYYLTTGRVRLCTLGERGDAQVRGVITPGKTLGLTETLTGDPSSATAQTVLASEVVFLPAKYFLDFMHAHPVAAFRITQSLSDALTEVYEQMRSF